MTERAFPGEFEHFVLAPALRLERGHGTPEALRALADHREALLRVWDGLEARFEDA